jgi:hypothetical protein
MTAETLFDEVDGPYLALIHLEYDVDEAVARISQAGQHCQCHEIDQLLRDGSSWRQRLTGLVMASIHGIEEHYDSLLGGFQKTGGISIVPMSAAISVAVRDRDCKYDLGMSDSPECTRGPNYGQDFAKHLNFYTTLYGP